jgi:hypothetical protein
VRPHRPSPLALGLFGLGLLVAAWVAWFALHVAATNDESRANDRDANARSVTAPELESDGERAAESARARATETDERERDAGVPREGISIRLVDARGRGVADRELVVGQEQAASADRRTSLTQIVRTGADGRARVSARMPSDVTAIEIELANGDRLRCSPDETAASSEPDELVVRCPDLGRVHGRVVDPSGKPRQDVYVALDVRHTAPIEFGITTFKGEDVAHTTDESGVFDFVVPLGWYALEIRDHPSASAIERAHVELTDDVREIAIELVRPPRERVVRVRVEAPVEIAAEEPDFVVVAHGTFDEAPRPRPPGVTARTRPAALVRTFEREGDSWLVRIEDTGHWLVSAGGGRFARATTDIPLRTREIALRVALTTPRAAPNGGVVFAGNVVDARGRPRTGSVSAFRVDDGRWIVGEMTLADGSFQLCIPERAEGASETSASIVLVAADRPRGMGWGGPLDAKVARSGLRLEIPEPLQIRGQIRGIPGGMSAWITARPLELESAHTRVPRGSPLARVLGGATTSDSDGTFVVQGLGAGEHELQLAPEIGSSFPPARTRVRAGESCRIELGTGFDDEVVFDCFVRDARTKQWIADTKIEVLAEDGERQPTGSNGTTDAGGHCRLRGHEPGRWIVAASKDGYVRREEAPADVRTSCTVIFELAPACTLDLALTDANGARLEDVEACVVPVGGLQFDLHAVCELEEEFARSDAAGRLVLERVAAGRVRVVFGWKEGKATRLRRDEKLDRLVETEGFATLELDAEPGVRKIVKHVLK